MKTTIKNQTKFIQKFKSITIVNKKNKKYVDITTKEYKPISQQIDIFAYENKYIK